MITVKCMMMILANLLIQYHLVLLMNSTNNNNIYVIEHHFIQTCTYVHTHKMQKYNHTDIKYNTFHHTYS